MKSVVIPRLNKMVHRISKEIHYRFEGKYHTVEYERAFIDALQQVDLNVPGFRLEIARTFVKADVARRSNIDPFTVDADGHIQYELFEQKHFENGVIRLGEGMLVKMADATAQEWLVRVRHQQKAAEASQQAATKTTSFLQTPPGILLLENPRAKLRDAMKELTLWTLFDPTDDDDDDDDDNED